MRRKTYSSPAYAVKGRSRERFDTVARRVVSKDMSRIRKALTIIASATVLALPAGCNDDDVDKAAKDAKHEAGKAVDKAKTTERDVQNDKDLP